MKVVVTGSEGFIGRHLVKRLEGIDVLEVHSIDKNNQDFPIDIAAQSMEQIDNLAATFEKPDYVVMLAADLQDTPDAYGINAAINHKTMQAFRGPDTRYIYISSAAVYGNAIYAPKDRVDPWGYYGQAKYLGERIIHTYLHSSRIKIMRLGNVFGPGDEIKLEGLRYDQRGPIIPTVAHAAMNGGRVLLNNSGSATRDFIYIYDVIDAIYSLIFHKNVWENSTDIWNVSSGQPTLINSLAHLIYAIFDTRWEEGYSYSTGHTSEIHDSVLRTDITPKFTLYHALQSTINHYLIQKGRPTL